jgi:hypothetical protein
MECHRFLMNKESFDLIDDQLFNFFQSMPPGNIQKADAKQLFTDFLDENGWIFKFKYSSEIANTITAVRSEVGVCAQFGNVARLFYDVLKLEYCYNAKIIDKSIIVCPLSPSGNRAYLDRLDRELKVYKNIVTVPICAIGINI